MRPSAGLLVSYVGPAVGKLFLLFTIVPAIELYLLISLGGILGAEATIGIVLATGFLGASLAKREGGRVFREWQGALARGEMPKEGLVSSLLVLVGGVLLVTPGVLTDAFGIAMLIPPSRRVVARMLQSYAQKRLAIEPMGPMGPMGPAAFIQAGASAAAPEAGDVIDVEARAKDDSATPE